MFRIESYITTIILSYVDRYISNFKRKDAQVSLWEGDAVFHNLDLDLEVLDQEFNLPLSFVSGHVHELHIHVPWTRIASEPVTITINTIECVMKLKRPGQEQKTKKKKKKTSAASEEAPPTYTTGLANKVVYNLNITCNNLILKYVDEDIVLSMNIKTLNIVTVNSKWVPMYCVLTPENLILRKLVSLSDVTICLDKRNASGRIESYLEPLLYKCSLKIRISKTFPCMNNFNAIKTTIAVHTEDVTLSISEPQVTMLLRIILLAKVAFNPPRNGSSTSMQSTEAFLDNSGDHSEEGVSWGTWAWNMIPSIFPSAYDAPEVVESLQSIDFAIYIDSFSINLKLTEERKSWQSFMKADFQGCFLEMLTNGTTWTNLQCGISYFTIYPLPSSDEGAPFINCGQKLMDYKKKSLYENPDMNVFQKSWEQHISSITEKTLSERAPACVIDFISVTETPPDNWIDDYASEPQERVLTRFVVGVLSINVTPDFIERVEIIKRSVKNYDYPSYIVKSATSLEETVQRTRDDDSSISGSLYIPQAVYQFTLVEVTVKVFTKFPHKFQSTKMIHEISKIILSKQEPYLFFKIRSLDGSYVKPLHPETLLMIKDQISPTRELISASMTTISVSLLAINMGLKINGVALPDMWNLLKLGCSMSFNSIFNSGPDAICQHCTIQMEECSMTTSKAKLMLSVNLVESLILNCCPDILLHSSLIQDVINSSCLPYLKVSVYKIQGVFAQSQVSESIKLKIGSLDAFSFHINEPEKPFTFLYAGRSLDSPVFDGIAQRPLNDSVAIPFLVYFKLWQFHINLDPSIFKWLMYSPQVLVGNIPSWTTLECGMSRKISNSSVSSNRKLPEILERKDIPKDKSVSNVSPTDSSKTSFDFDWLMKWLSLAVFGEITDVKFTYTSFPTQNNCLLVVWVPSVCLTSAQGKFVVDTDSLPVPYGVLKKNVIAFPLRLEINGICGWSVCDGLKDNFIDEFTTSCTIALTTRVVPSPLIAFTLHIDTSHISVSLNQIQMCCLTNFCLNLTKILNMISLSLRKVGERNVIQETKFTSSEDSVTNSQSLISSIPINEAENKTDIKFSFWLQWTLTKLTISLYATPLRTSPNEFLKLSLELEDLITSVDIDMVHEKLKMKVGSSTIKHYARDVNGSWRVGCFGGVMMRAYESSGNNSEFLSLTVTRATAANVHKKIAASSKISYQELSAGHGPEDRNVIEIVVKLEPLDFVISPFVLMRFISIIEPILQSEPLTQPSTPPGPPLSQLTTADLPLVYFDLQQLRVFLCASTQPLSKPDTLVIHVEDITLGSEAVNPVSRKILRSGLSRMTTVPGSKNEDRQYQLDLSIQITTGKWKELEPHVCGNADADENPAVTWNTIGAPQAGKGAPLSPVLNKLGVSFILAPPILTAGVLVSGLYFEGNMISEAEIRLSLDQLKLCVCIYSELALVIPETSEASFEFDSGIESVEGSVSVPCVRGELIEMRKPTRLSSQISVATSTSINTRGIRQRTQIVPSDILLTGKGIMLKLFSAETNSSQFFPLLYVSIVQPYISLEKQGDTTIHKASIFDLDIRHGSEGFLKDSLEKDDFIFHLVQTKEGDPDPYKGIPPALLNFKSSVIGMKLPSVDVEMGRPLKLSVKVSSIHFINWLQEVLLSPSPEQSIGSSMSIPTVAASGSALSSLHSASLVSIKSFGSYSYVQSISSFNITTKQLAVQYYPKESGQTAILSLSEFEGSLTFPNSQINVKLGLKTVAFSIAGHLLLTPWSLQCSAFLSSEGWLSQHLFRASICSDILAIEVYPSQVRAILGLLDEIEPLIESNETKSKTKEKNAVSKEEDDEEIYKDDLQTGAFQFTSGTDVPLPYQVTFPSPAVMAWAYPQPRAISSLTILPVPFNNSVTGSVELSLEYLDPLLGWCKWAKGMLTESQVSKVILPSRRRTACIWRVILYCDDLPIQSKALGGCIRVDSVFSRKLVPFIQISTSIDSLSVCFWAEPTKTPPFKHFQPIQNISCYPYATVSINCLKLGLHSWRAGEREIEIEGRPKVEILNAQTMKDVSVVHSLPMSFSCSFDDDDGFKFGIMGGIVSVFLAPSVSHTLAAAYLGFPIQPFIVCNDTTYNLSFRQFNAAEDIILPSLHCYFYSWKNSSQQMEMQFSVNRLECKLWSESVNIRQEGIFPVDIADDGGRKMTALVHVQKLSSVITQVTFSGELMVKNKLDKEVSVRVIATSISERQRIILLGGGEKCASVILHKESNYSIRLALDGGWSGLIPLKDSNSWLVKVPLQKKDQFLSLWCQVLKEKNKLYERILIIISPMYVIKSLLPCEANVLVKTQQLNSQINLTIPGKGTLTNLYAPGTTEHRHSLTFHIVGNIPSPAPHVVLSYSDVIKGSPPRALTLKDTLAAEENIDGKRKDVWPYLGHPWDQAAWTSTPQPSTVTRVKMRFCGEKLKVPHCIIVELEPWCLVVNTLGRSIAILVEEEVVCNVVHLSVVAPPLIEGLFQLLVKFSDGYHKSSSLQLSDNQSFYKPHIPGLIPQVASVQISINAPTSVVYAVFHSKIVNNIRLLHVSSAYVICNLSSQDLKVSCFSLKLGGRKLSLPHDDSVPFIEVPKRTTNDFLGEPIPEWIERGDALEKRLYLIFKGEGGLPGNPVPVPILSDVREREALLLPTSCEDSWFNTPLSVVFQENEGTTYITIDDDPTPQLIIHNHTSHCLYFGVSASPQGGRAVEESEDWNWCFNLPQGRCGYYRVVSAPGQPLPPIVVAKAASIMEWSGAISLTAGTATRLVGLPGTHDLIVSVTKVAFTIHLTLTPAHQSLISAADVRSRLTQHVQGGLQTTSEEGTRQITTHTPYQVITCREGCLQEMSGLSKISGGLFVKGFYLTLCAESDNTPEWKEISVLSLENIVATLDNNKERNLGKASLRVTVWDVQIDNQEHQKGGYDYSVVLIGRGSKSDDNCDMLEIENRDLESLISVYRDGSPAIDITLGFDVTHLPVLEDVKITISPLELFLEDIYLTELKNHLENLVPKPLPLSKELFFTPIKNDDEDSQISVDDEDNVHDDQRSGQVAPFTSRRADDLEFNLDIDESDDWEDDIDKYNKVPLTKELLSSSYELSRPLKLSSLCISPLFLRVSLHTSTKFYIALDQSPLSFAEFKRTDIVTSSYRLGHALTLHYFLGAIYGTGWALGSLQLLGAPAGLARSLGAGLTSLVSLPCEGLAYGPAGFLFGVLHGSASLMRHVTAGTLGCVTKLAGSWSRTLDRLTLDSEDLRYAEEMRRIRPHGLADGLRQGLTEFGVSILGGVGGLVQRPLEYAMGSGGTLVGSVSRGLVGAMTRPLSGAASLVAVTTQGILAEAGWAQILKTKHAAGNLNPGRDSRFNYGAEALLIVEGTNGDLQPCDLVLTPNSLKLITPNAGLRLLFLSDIVVAGDRRDPTLVLIYQQTHSDFAEKLSQKRIAEYLRESQRALGSPLPPTPPSLDPEPLLFYLNPEVRDYFVSYVQMVARHSCQKGFLLIDYIPSNG